MRYFDINRNNGSKLLLTFGGVLALSVAIYFIWPINFSFFDKELSVPKISEQPKDTLVSKGKVKIHKWETKNGTKVYFVPTEGLPIVDINVIFDAGASRDGLKYGLSNLVSSMLEEGTTSLTADKIAESFENNAAEFQAGSGNEMTAISVRTLVIENVLKDVVDTLKDVITNPDFNQESLERIKKQVAVNLKYQEQKPGFIANKEFLKGIYGNHPYSNYPLGERATVEKISSQDLKSFHKKYYTCKNAVVVIVGGIHRDVARGVASRILEDLPIGEKAKSFLEPKFENKNVVNNIEFNSAQSHIFVGELGISATDNDYFALEIADNILGGGIMTSRLWHDVRESKGLAYSVYSTFETKKDKGLFRIGLQTKSSESKNAIKVVKNTVNKFVKNGISDEELDGAKKYLTGSFGGSLNSNKKILNNVSKLAFYGLPSDYFDTYIDKINSVSKEKVNEIIQKKIHPNKMFMVVVGAKQ